MLGRRYSLGGWDHCPKHVLFRGNLGLVFHDSFDLKVGALLFLEESDVQCSNPKLKPFLLFSQGPANFSNASDPGTAF